MLIQDMKMKAESQFFWITQNVFFPLQFETAVQIPKLVLYYRFNFRNYHKGKLY